MTPVTIPAPTKLDITFALDILSEHVLTEENTDKLIEVLLDKVNLPWWIPERIIRRVLDQLLPETLLQALRSF